MRHHFLPVACISLVVQTALFCPVSAQKSEVELRKTITELITSPDKALEAGPDALVEDYAAALPILKKNSRRLKNWMLAESLFIRALLTPMPILSGMD